MGGRGATSATATLSGGGTITMSLSGDDINDFDNNGTGTIDPSTLTKSMADLQAMTDDEFEQYIKDVKNADMPLFLAGWDTQRFIYASNINGLPEVVDDKTFKSMAGQTIYRTVNSAYDSKTDVGMTAKQIAQQTQGGMLSRIGGGIYGDGYYFATDRGSSTAYGNVRGNVNKTAVMEAKLNSNAKVISYSKLTRMYYNESPQTQRTINGMSAGLSGGEIAVYALRKGYNVIDAGGGYINVIDRSAMTMNSKITAM